MLATMFLAMAVQNVDSLLTTARTMTTAEPRCARAADATEITICGRREADRYRVPFVVHDPGDRRYESVGAERERLTHKKNAIEEASAILVGTGMAGVSTTVGGSSGGKAVVTGYRPLAR